MLDYLNSFFRAFNGRQRGGVCSSIYRQAHDWLAVALHPICILNWDALHRLLLLLIREPILLRIVPLPLHLPNLLQL